MIGAAALADGASVAAKSIESRFDRLAVGI